MSEAARRPEGRHLRLVHRSPAGAGQPSLLRAVFLAAGLGCCITLALAWSSWPTGAPIRPLSAAGALIGRR